MHNIHGGVGGCEGPGAIWTAKIPRAKLLAVLWTGSALQCVSQNLKRLRMRRAIIVLGNGFSVDAVAQAWERKFVYCSLHTRFAMIAI